MSKREKSSLQRDFSSSLQILGLGFLVAWVYCIWYVSDLHQTESPQPLAFNSAWLIFAFAATVMSLIGIGFGRRADFSSIPHLVPMSSLMMTSGTVAILALPSFHAGGASPLGVLAIVIASAGSIALLVLWAELLSRFDTSHIEVVVPAAFIATIFRAFVLPQANLGVLNAVVAALPLLSGLFLKISIVVADRDAKVKLCKAKLKLLAPRSLSLRQLLLSGMACLVFYALCCAAPYISGMRMVGESDGWLIMAASLVAVALAYGITLFSRRVDILAAYGWIGPVLLVGIGCAAYSDPLPLKASGLLVSAAFSCAEIVFLLYFIQLGKTTDCRMTLAVCFAEAMMYGGSLLGNAFGALAQEVLDLGMVHPYELCVPVLVAIGIVSLALPQIARLLDWSGGFKDVPLDSNAVERDTCSNDRTLPIVAESSDARDLFGEMVADRYGLTAREREILLLLVRGRDRAFIRDALYISKNTIATHIKHIYQKTGAHSQQDLITLLEDCENSCKDGKTPQANRCEGSCRLRSKGSDA